MVSVFFNNVTNRPEQELIESLVVESIHLYGQDVFYLPRTIYKTDEILNEISYYAFKDALQTEMYFKNVDSFEGDGKFLAKFGLEVREQVTLVIANRTFNKEVYPFVNITRPREGDLVYIPMLEAAYQIKFVEDNSIYYQVGNLTVAELTCELFEYSQEVFDTGIESIDNKYMALYKNDAVNRLLTQNSVTITTERGEMLAYDEKYDSTGDMRQVYADNNDLQVEFNKVVDWSEKDPFSEQGIY